MTNGAQLLTSVRKAAEDDTLAAGQGNAGNVNIDVSDAVTIAGSRSTVYSDLGEEAIGNGGDINIRSGSLSLTDSGALFAASFGQGNAGSIVLQVDESVSLANADNARPFSYTDVASLSTGSYGQGDGGDIIIKAGLLSVTNGAYLNSATYGQGNAGNVIIEADGTVSFVGAVVVNGLPLPSAAFSAVGALLDQGIVGTGNGGDIRIAAESLSLTDDAYLTASTLGQGDAGSVFVQTNDSVSLKLQPYSHHCGIASRGQGWWHQHHGWDACFDEWRRTNCQ